MTRPIVIAAALLVAALAAPALPPLGTIITIAPATNPNTVALRHCDYDGAFMPVEPTNDDFLFTIVPALSGAPLPAVSFRSTNFPAQHLTLKHAAPPVGSRIGIAAVAPADAAEASWTVTTTGAPDGSVTLAPLAPALVGSRLTFAATNSGPCNAARPSGDATLAAAGDAPRQALLLGKAPTPGPTPSPAPAPSPIPVALTVDARAIDHVIPREFKSCHFDPGFATSPAAWSSNMIYGQAFVKGPSSIYAWADVSTATGSAALDNATIMNALVVPPAATLALTKTGGAGVVGWANRGEGGEGLVFEAAREYEGYAMVLAPRGGDVVFAIGDRNANTTLATTTITVAASPVWQRVAFANLVPTAGTTCVGIAFASDATIDCGRAPSDGMNPGIICVRCGGEFSVGLASIGAIHVGFVTLQPGAWGRFAGLPVLKSGTDMLQRLGFGGIRQGGSVSQSLRWKDWRGAPEARAAMSHVWGPTLVAPWGPFEFLDMANALNVTPILTLAWDLNTVDDWGDLVDYLFADATTAWGRVRAVNDSHPAPFRIDTFELGNEQANPLFVQQIQAIETRLAKIPGAPVLLYMYPENAGPNATVIEQLISAGVPPRRVTADCHVGASGGVACAEASTVWADYDGAGINCETNARTSNLVRGVEEAADLLTWFNQNASTTARLRARTASFCVQRAGQLRDPWDQGLSFFLPNATWLQPPGAVHALFSDTWLGNALAVNVTAGGALFAGAAQMAADGSRVAVQLVNRDFGVAANTVAISLAGFAPAAAADLYIIAEPGAGAVNSTAGNTAARPDYIRAVRSAFAVPAAGPIVVTLPPLSVAVLVLAAAA